MIGRLLFSGWSEDGERILKVTKKSGNRGRCRKLCLWKWKWNTTYNKKSQDIISADSGTFQNEYFLNLRTSEIHLFYNLQLFYWHFLEFLWLFIFQVFYFSFLFSLLLEVSLIKYKIKLINYWCLRISGLYLLWINFRTAFYYYSPGRAVNPQIWRLWKGFRITKEILESTKWMKRCPKEGYK